MTGPSQQAAWQAQLADGSLAGNWTLDPARSTATLRSKSMWGLVPVKGAFRDLDGTGTVSPAGEVTGRITVAAGSLDTKNARRDKHLRSADFFDTEKFPAITFTLDKLTPASTGAVLSGTLTVRDRSRPVTFNATASPAGDGDVALDATIQADRSQYGLTWNQLGMVSKNNTITIHAVFTRA
jgi:polyisoprenoid-binding protein YceI